MTRCPLCGQSGTTLHARARDIEYYTTDRTFDIRHCPTCEILFVDPMLSSQLGVIYPPSYYSFLEGSQNLVTAVKEWLDRRGMQRLTRSISGQHLAVLDVGGGTGWLVDQVRSADPRFEHGFVIDIDEQAQYVAVRKNYRYFLGRFEEFDPGAQKFDLILMLNLIEHVSDPRAVLEKAASMLAEGGVIWIKTPNFDSLDARIFRDRSWAGFHTPRHFVIFKRESLERLAAQCGMVVTSFAYTQGAPFWSVSLLDALRRLGMVNISSDRPAVYHPLNPILQALTAAFDFARRPFGARLSQMVLTLRRSDTPK